MRAAIVSTVVPPSWSGQGVALFNLLESWEPSSYCFITHGARPAASAATRALDGHCYRIRTDARSASGTTDPWLRAQEEVDYRASQMAAILAADGADVVIGTTGDLHDLPAAARAARKAGIPFVPYFFDSYLNQWRGHDLARRFERELMASAPLCIVPNEFTADEYRRSYATRPVVVRNPSRPLDLDALDRQPSVLPSGAVNIVYTGAVYAANAGALRNLVRALERLGRDDIRLHIYTEQRAALDDYGIAGPHVVAHAHAPHGEIGLIQRQADILFLPLGFDRELAAVLRTSAPGKTGEYLAAGRPILAHVPDDSFVAWYFARHGCGVVAAGDDVDRLCLALEGLLASGGADEAAKAVQCAERDFDLRLVQRQFRELVASVCAGSVRVRA